MDSVKLLSIGGILFPWFMDCRLGAHSALQRLLKGTDPGKLQFCCVLSGRQRLLKGTDPVKLQCGACSHVAKLCFQIVHAFHLTHLYRPHTRIL
jgi:hypothetical protein